MNYGKDDELLEWDMETDQNFEDALDREEQNFNQTSAKTKPEQSSKKPSRLWTSRSREYDQTRAFDSTEHRKSGDGDSVTSQDMVGSNGESYSATTKVNTLNTGSPLAAIKDQTDASSFSEFARSYDQTGRKGFTILEEDDADITSYDISPMEFRGTLKTGNSPYKPETSCCCVLLRFLTVAMLSLAVGMVIGYYMGTSNMLEVHVTEPTAATRPTTTRDVFNNTMAMMVNTTSETSSLNAEGTIGNNSSF